MALPEWLMSFLLKTLLPWVISLMAAAVDKYLRPYTTAEGFSALQGLFQSFYDDAIVANRETVQYFIVGVISPIFGIEITTPQPVDPAVVSEGALKLLAGVAEDIGSDDVFVAWNNPDEGQGN